MARRRAVHRRRHRRGLCIRTLSYAGWELDDDANPRIVAWFERVQQRAGWQARGRGRTGDLQGARHPRRAPSRSREGSALEPVEADGRRGRASDHPLRFKVELDRLEPPAGLVAAGNSACGKAIEDARLELGRGQARLLARKCRQHRVAHRRELRGIDPVGLAWLEHVLDFTASIFAMRFSLVGLG